MEKKGISMKVKKIISLIAAAAVSLSLAGCSIEFGTKNKTFADTAITSVKLNDDHILAKPVGENTTGGTVDYLSFKKEYLYWLMSNGITDDSEESVEQAAASQRYNIINYLVNEQVILAKAKELGLDTFTAEELDAIEKSYQEKIDENIQYFMKNTDFSSESESELSEEEKLILCEEKFDNYLKNSLLTRDDLLNWERSALLTQKVTEEITKDIQIDRSEAVDALNNYAESVKKMYTDDPASYEQNTELATFWIPEGTRNIKHILIGINEIDSDEISAMRKSGDEEGADALRTEKLAEIEQKAIEVKNMLDNGADFDELIAEYSADATGSKYNPDGYMVIPNSTMYVKEFVEAAFSIENIGEYILTASDYGWHIVMYASDTAISKEDTEDYINYLHETLIETAKEQKRTEAMKQWHEEYKYEIDFEALGIVELAQAETDGT